MPKKTTPPHTQAKKYLDTYTGKIREKFLDQKKDQELWKILKFSPENQEELRTKMREDMKSFVKELQSEENYVAMKKIYHEQMKNIHSFNKLIHDYSQEIEKLQMKEHKNLAKEKFFNENINVWKKFIKTFKEKWHGLTPLQQKKTFQEMNTLMNDPSAFKKFIQKNNKKIALSALGIGIPWFMARLTYFAFSNHYTWLWIIACGIDFIILYCGLMIITEIY